MPGVHPLGMTGTASGQQDSSPSLDLQSASVQILGLCRSVPSDQLGLGDHWPTALAAADAVDPEPVGELDTDAQPLRTYRGSGTHREVRDPVCLT